MAISYIKHVGSFSGAVADSCTITIPAGGIPVGNRLILRASHWTGNDALTASDPRGNTWNVDDAQGYPSAGQPRSVVLSAHITTALQAGDLVTIAHSSTVQKRAFALDEFSGVDMTSTGSPSASNSFLNGTNPTATISPSGLSFLVLGHVGVEGTTGDSFAQDTDTDGGATWSTLARVGSSGGGAASNRVTNGAYKIVPGGTYTYNPTIASRDGDIQLLAYAAATTDTTAPTANITVSPDVTRISRVAGKDVTIFSFQSNETYQAYELRVVTSESTPRASGTLIESGSGGAANTNRQVSVTDDELVAAGIGDGIHKVKVFVQDNAGNWSV